MEQAATGNATENLVASLVAAGFPQYALAGLVESLSGEEGSFTPEPAAVAVEETLGPASSSGTNSSDNGTMEVFADRFANYNSANALSSFGVARALLIALPLVMAH